MSPFWAMRGMMRNLLHGLTLIAVLLLASCGGSQLPVNVPGGAEQYDRVLNSVVAMVVPTEEGLMGPTCTAFFISETDLITAGHCVLQARQELVFTPSGIAIRVTYEEAENAIGRQVHFVTRQQHSEWAGTNEDDRSQSPSYVTATVMAVRGPEDEDMALLRILDSEPRATQWLEVRDWQTEPPRAGEEAYAVSNPVGDIWMLTRGVISSVQTNLDNSVEVYHDARVGHGSSGSPLLDALGRVVGINVRINRGNILSIATPSSVIQTLYGLLETRLEIEELDREQRHQQLLEEE